MEKLANLLKGKMQRFMRWNFINICIFMRSDSLQFVVESLLIIRYHRFVYGDCCARFVNDFHSETLTKQLNRGKGDFSKGACS